MQNTNESVLQVQQARTYSKGMHRGANREMRELFRDRTQLVELPDGTTTEHANPMFPMSKGRPYSEILSREERMDMA